MQPTLINQTDDYFVINKPPAMATEPPSVNPTVRDWLIEQKYINPSEWGSDDRCGIVHRLDTDTSGVLLWARNQAAQTALRQTWQGRAVKKTYLALVVGRTEPSGVIELPIERDNRNDRQRVALLPSPKSRPALTEFKTLARTRVGEREVSLVEFHPITGRTHQIRVHAKAIGHPLVGDALYGEKASDELAAQLGVRRQFLHAATLTLPDGAVYAAPVPEDLRTVLERLALPVPLYSPEKTV